MQLALSMIRGNSTIVHDTSSKSSIRPDKKCS